MARLFEYQGKALLKQCGISVPESRVAWSAEDARIAAADLGCPVMVKAQAWISGRGKAGGIRRAESPAEAESIAADLLGSRLKGFRVQEVLVEKCVDIAREFYVGISVDDDARAPVLVISSAGGMSVEEAARQNAASVAKVRVNPALGLQAYQVRDVFRRIGLSGADLLGWVSPVLALSRLARDYECRTVEINPWAVTTAGERVALDCRIAVDDYAVYRHPELSIEVARDMDRPATPLERIAYRVEEGDYRGTFYFMQLETDLTGEGQESYIGFHGSGGGGAMMAMDALLRQGLRVANFCDTSGNPAASKVCRAARIILSQPGIRGYFYSGSGVASQEQTHTARGLVKAFNEARLSIPAVVRLGGNMEAEAIDIMRRGVRNCQARIEVYGSDVDVDFCAARMRALLAGVEGQHR
jgi:succinyl-CoA synthetase beta subunit